MTTPSSLSRNEPSWVKAAWDAIAALERSEHHVTSKQKSDAAMALRLAIHTCHESARSEIGAKDAVIEECARICDGFTSNPNAAEYAYRCASAIRDLKGAQKAEEKPTIRVQLVGPTLEQTEKAHKSGIVNEGDVRLVWIVESDLWPLDARYTVQEFKP